MVTAPEVADQLAPQRESIYRYILGIVRNGVEAEDLTQETLLRAYDKLATLEEPARLIPWLYRIATNITYDRFRQASYRHRPKSLAEDDSETGAGGAEIALDTEPRLDKVMEQREMSACVQDYIAALPESYRAVILLHDVQGLTNPEIAEMLGVSLATVKIRLHRARGKLRAALGAGCSFESDEPRVRVCEPKS
ncbi:MAG: RNA polymerase sigma factor [bacterium]|nr:RNA polymerase sigma factor [bacterium]